MSVILWFKRDLRVADHPALARAAALGRPLIPLYIVEPEMWAQADASARQWRFVLECLVDLDRDLRGLGAPLVVRRGDAVAMLEALRSAHGVSDLISHEETGTQWSFARDRRVGAWARAQGVTWHELAQNGVVRARQRGRFMRAPLAVAPAISGPVVEGDGLPDARELGLDWDPCLARQKGGRVEAERCLGSFLATPLEGEAACSRVSPHLSWGSLSVREAVQAAGARAAEGKGLDDSLKAIRSFQSRLALRDNHIQKLEVTPNLDRKCLHSAYEGLRPRGGETGRLHAWASGATGLPFVDACMRCLAQTGWLSFRARSLVVAVASYHLWLDWRDTGPILAQMFTDYEPGIHWSQMQLQSGTTGIRACKIPNPDTQGREQDPKGIFIRRWVPELRDVPHSWIHAPMRWPQAERLLKGRYPWPIVDVAGAARAARARVGAVRGSDRFQAEARAILGGGVPDGYASVGRVRRQSRDARQLAFDL